MKAEFLKLAGVKSEKAFYKKYPTEAAFFKAHPEAKKSVKKAQYGTVMSGLSDYLQSMNNTATTPYPGTMFKQPGIPMANYQQAPNYDQMYMSMSTADEQLSKSASPYEFSVSGMDKAINKVDISKQSSVDAIKGPSFGDQVNTYAPMAGQLIAGYQNLRAGRRARKEAEKWAKVTDVQARASETEDVDDLRQYADNARKRRNALMPEMTGEEFFPVYGVGTNVLARNGARLQDGGMIGGNPTEIQNTYEGGTDIYTDLEYEPLYNVNQIKSYQSGGRLHQMQNGGYAESQDYYNQIINAGKSTGIISGGDVAGGGTPWGAIGGIGSSVAGNLTGNDGGGQMGGAIGGAAGMVLGGPLGMAVGQTLGTAVGGLLDTNDRDQRKAEAKIKANTNRMAASQYREAMQQGPFGSYMKDGGWVSNDWTPQVIASFGDLTSEDYHRFAHKDEFRAGGHLKSYTPPSARAMETFDMGGELKTHWGGYAEPMSHNPYLPGTGQTVMFRGKSHDERSPNGETGIGITYGGNPVEVERGEPMVELEDGGTMDPETGEPQKSGVVFGNLKIPNQYIDLLGDPKAKGKKFKNYVADLSKTEDKQNKMIEKSTNELNALDVTSSFDRLKLSSLEANIKGGNMKLQDIAAKKINAAGLQNAINDTAEEYGLVADDLARGKVKFDKEAMTTREARLGAAISKAKDGITTTTEQTTLTPTFRTDKEALDAGYKKVGNEYIKITQSTKKVTKEKKSAKAMDNIPKQKINKTTGLGNITPEQFEAYKKKNDWYPDWDTFDPTDPEDVDKYAKAFNAEAEKRGSKARILPDDVATGKVKWVGEQLLSSSLDTEQEESPIGEFIVDTAKIEKLPDTKPIEYKRSALLDIFGQVLPFIRPTDQEALNARQLMGETYAMSTNQLEPVQATPYTPQLRVPYDISRQAAKNDLIAQTRAAQRMAQGNPEMQAAIAAQAYNPMQQLNEQDFIDNQRMRDAVYSGNIATLNDAELKNLSIYDQQYQRQEQAKSNTKATAQAALNSISDKYAKNALENRTLGVYENLYNYRYDAAGRLINMNAPFQPNISRVASVNSTQRQVPVYDKEGKINYYQLEEYDPSANRGVGTAPINRVAKDGKSIVKKNNKNSSIVKAIKNL